MKTAIFSILLFVVVSPLFAIPFSQVMDLKRYEKMARSRFMELGRQRKELAMDLTHTNDVNHKKYREFTHKMAYYKDKMWQFHEAQNYDTHVFYVVRDTLVWSAQDAWEMGKILFNTNTLKRIIKQEWTDLIKSTYDAMFRMKIRKIIKEELGCDSVKGLEDTLMGMVLPEVQKSENWKKIEGGADKALDKLKEKYEQAAMRRFKAEWLKKTKGMNKEAVEKMATKYGKEVMESATKSIDAFNFTSDIAQKIYFWNEYEPVIRNTVAQIKLMKNRYAAKDQNLSCEDIYQVWAGKKKIPLQKTNHLKELTDIKNSIEIARKKLKNAHDAGLAQDAQDLQTKIELLTKLYVEKGGQIQDLDTEYVKSNEHKDQLSDSIKILEKEIEHARSLGLVNVVREKNMKLKVLKKQALDNVQASSQIQSTEGEQSKLLSALKKDSKEIHNLFEKIKEEDSKSSPNQHLLDEWYRRVRLVEGHWQRLEKDYLDAGGDPNQLKSDDVKW